MKKLLVLTYLAMEAMLIVTRSKLNELLFVTLIMCGCKLGHETDWKGACSPSLLESSYQLSIYGSLGNNISTCPGVTPIP